MSNSQIKEPSSKKRGIEGASQQLLTRTQNLIIVSSGKKNLIAKMLRRNFAVINCNVALIC